MRILVLHGPNLQLLGRREPDVYGSDTLDTINRVLTEKAVALGVEVDCFQSNQEGDLVTCIGDAPGTYAGLIINPAAYTHTSIALRDAIKAVDLPCVEVHLSNISQRETFRQVSFTAGVCIAQIAGFGGKGYVLALEGLVEHIKKQ
ncbi:MAG: type II 3-dehydroquinate dehydratase [Kiritimatiellae bacterium]|nr:type II 3-dehydroquinate dehydratase [Kiritimatiellia bacterium]MDD4735937.1 type II 3-dehydroquinate dehydratase [Kiritimatiellia bacterium]